MAYIVKQLQTYPTGDGKTLFDNTLLFWANDLGTGPHSRKRYPFLLATGDFTLPTASCSRPAATSSTPAARPTTTC